MGKWRQNNNAQLFFFTIILKELPSLLFQLWAEKQFFQHFIMKADEKQIFFQQK